MKETYMNETDPKKKYVCYNSDEYIIDGIGKETIEGLVTDTLIINKGKCFHTTKLNSITISLLISWIKIIIITHSPSTVALCPDNSIYQLKNEPNSTLLKIEKNDATEEEQKELTDLLKEFK